MSMLLLFVSTKLLQDFSHTMHTYFILCYLFLMLYFFLHLIGPSLYQYTQEFLELFFVNIYFSFLTLRGMSYGLGTLSRVHFDPLGLVGCPPETARASIYPRNKSLTCVGVSKIGHQSLS